MKSIQQKLLINFCLTALACIVLVGIVVSVKIRENISEQAEKLADDMTRRTYETLNLPHQTFELLIRNDIRRSANDLRTSATLAANFESDRLKALQAELYTTATERNVDVAILFDLHGRITASFPIDIHAVEVERYMESWAFGTHILSVLQDETTETTEIWETFARHDSQSLTFLGLGERDIAGKGALSFVAAGMLRNDFNEPLGICLVGKLLNQHTEPLQHLNDIAGYAGAIYLDTAAIAQAGFETSEHEEVDLSTLQIDAEVQTAVLNSPEKINQILTLAGQPYLTACAALQSFVQEPIGMLCIGLPRANVAKLQDTIVAYGSDTVRNIQWWIVRIGLISLCVFALASLVIAAKIIKPLIKSIDFAKSVAGGDLVATMDVTQQDEIGTLVNTLKEMSSRLREMVSSIKDAADNVASGSQEMSLRAEQISQGANEQAAATEEASLSMEQMTATIKQNTENAQQTGNIARQLAEDALNGGNAVAEAVDAMRKIARKIAIVEDIANQTRILSLNATIESARAQEHGKGFSVVAAEVRALSERTQQAAAEINQLAGSSVGTAEKAGDMLSSLVPDIQKTAELVQEISAASREQSTGVEQINKAMQQLDTITQQNFVAIEAMTTTAQELSLLADRLQKAMAFFRIHNEQRQ